METYEIDMEFFQVINAPHINPANLWERRPDGLYDMLGGPSGWSLDQYELKAVTRKVRCMRVAV